jgi:thiol:disulfide interchange protein DsbA
MNMLRPILLLVTLSFAALAGAAGPATAPDLELNGQYEAITPPQQRPDASKVEVIELFWYGCPHCYELEPFLSRWAAARPPDVDFVQMPAVFSNNRLWMLHAQAFYAAEVLGVRERLHAAMFQALHVSKRPLDTKERLRTFFKENGVAEADFERVWDSFAVQTRVRQAVVLTERFGIDGVPAIVVNRKYRTSGSLTGTYANLLKVVDSLIQRERAAPAGAAK